MGEALQRLAALVFMFGGIGLFTMFCIYAVLSSED